jgi:hypothetical protein
MSEKWLRQILLPRRQAEVARSVWFACGLKATQFSLVFNTVTEEVGLEVRSVRISGGTPAILIELIFSSVSPGKCRDSISLKSRLYPSKSFQFIYHLSFNATQSRYWERRSAAQENKDMHIKWKGLSRKRLWSVSGYHSNILTLSNESCNSLNIKKIKMKGAVFWDVMSCRLVEIYWYFGGNMAFIFMIDK